MLTIFVNLLLCLVIASCATPPSPNVLPTETGRVHRGFDLRGEAATCSAMQEGGMCTMEFGPGDEFAAACRKQGGLALQCECHAFLCSQKLVSADKHQ